MTNGLSTDQIVDRIKSGLSPHRVTTDVDEFSGKLSFKVWPATDGEHVYTVPNLKIHELASEHYLVDVIEGVRREVNAKNALLGSQRRLSPRID